MDGLIAFWTARLDEIEQAARAAGAGTPEGSWSQADPDTRPGRIEDGTGNVVTYDEGSPDDGQAPHIALNDPASALADVAADRALIELLGQAAREDDYDVSRVMREVASIRAARFSSHPEWKQEWAP